MQKLLGNIGFHICWYVGVLLVKGGTFWMEAGWEIKHGRSK